ncbi:MAG: hypothetical protein JXA73_03185, partial [Acidobacteria bacterium]|nr:hypothetical protein [Acidobacteriota bacterium]
FLGNQRDLWQQLKLKPFIRLQDGRHVSPFRIDGLTPRAYLPARDDSSFPTVKREVLADEKVLKFLREFGLREPDIVADVIESVLPHYTSGTFTSIESLDQHRKDIHKILRALATDSKQDRENLIRKLKNTPILRSVNITTQEKKYLQPEKIYADNNNIRLFYRDNPEAWLLDDCYTKEEQKELSKIGVLSMVRIQCKKPNSDGYIVLCSNWGHHRRGIGGFDPDCEIHGLDFALKHPTIEKSQFIWNEVLPQNQYLIRGKVETSNRQTYEGANRTERWSKTGEMLRDLEWLPKKGGGFFKPSELALNDLPDEFEKDELLAGTFGMKQSPITNLAAAVGVDASDIELIKAHPQEFAKFRDVVRRIQSRSENRPDKPSEEVKYMPEFMEIFKRPQINNPDPNPVASAPPTNKERYQKLISEDIEESRRNEPHPELRAHLVSRKAWEDKDNYVRIFLKEEYGGRCQICNSTFFKRDGEPYYEGVYLVSYTLARWVDNPGNVLCLCATCAAKFLYGAVEADSLPELMQAGGQAIEETGLSIRLCNEDKIIRFTPKHLSWLMGLIKTDE